MIQTGETTPKLYTWPQTYQIHKTYQAPDLPMPITLDLCNFQSHTKNINIYFIFSRNGKHRQRSQKRSKKHNTKTYKQKHPKSHKINTKHIRQNPKKRT
jgi:hypothetical protein